MKQIRLLATVVLCATLVLPRLAAAQTAPAIPPSNTTPDKSRPAPAHPLVGLCVYVGGICRAGRHDRHQSLLCRRAHGLNSCVGACHGIIVGISSRLLGLCNLPVVLVILVAAGLGVAVFVLGLPGRIAIARNHPEAEAVYLMGWIGFLAVVPWIQALGWAFRPTTVIDVRYLPKADGSIDTEAMIAKLTGRIAG